MLLPEQQDSSYSSFNRYQASLTGSASLNPLLLLNSSDAQEFTTLLAKLQSSGVSVGPNSSVDSLRNNPKTMQEIKKLCGPECRARYRSLAEKYTAFSTAQVNQSSAQQYMASHQSW